MLHVLAQNSIARYYGTYKTMNTVVCPHCKKQVELSEAIIHEFQDKIREEERKSVEAKLGKAHAEKIAESEKKLRIDLEKEAKERAKELEEEGKKRMLELEASRKKEKELEEKLEKEKIEREKAESTIKESARKKVQEEFELMLKQKDLQLEQARKANQELNRKLEQGSQQLQGEALELNLEEKLKAAFPNDEFIPVPKGIEGGDIWQKIKFKNQIVGSILWETKRTKQWSKLWLTKLKEDAGKISASESILVSVALPQDISSFDRKEGVWITTYEHSINICRYVRFLITTVASVKSSTDHTEEEWGQIRDYMMGDSFKHRMQAHFDGVTALRNTLDSEKKATILRWKKTESTIEKLSNNTINFYGELKTIVTNLPEIEELESPVLLEKNTQENLLEE
jgi:hypothetical protein